MLIQLKLHGYQISIEEVGRFHPVNSGSFTMEGRVFSHDIFLGGEDN
jgi:hypothetical protein